jgi:hypothetical protein
MSIVERAMQKAQQRAQERAAHEPVAPAPQPVEPAAAAPSPSAFVETTRRNEPSAAQLEQAPGVDLATSTARDVKPIVLVDVDQLRIDGRLPADQMSGQVDEEMRRTSGPLLAAIAGRGGASPARNNIVR